MYVRRTLFYLLIIIFLIPFKNLKAQSTPVLKINRNSAPIAAYSYIEILNDSSTAIKSEDIVFNKYDHLFVPFSKSHYQKGDIHWIRFKVKNESKEAFDVKISIPFTDYSTLIIPIDGSFYVDKTGDKISLRNRSTKIGQICFLNFKLPPLKEYWCYIKIQDYSPIAKDFQDLTLSSLRVYSQTAFTEHFEIDRMYHSFFFGALFIMFFFNLFIFFSTRSKDYFYYILYLLFLVVFYTSNLGYLLETVLIDLPKVDMYIRMLSPPFLLISYIQFSKTYLKSKEFALRLNSLLNFIIILLVCIMLVMVSGSWRIGRSSVIICAAATFLIILLLCITLVKKYIPARYFLAGNLLLLTAGIIYAIQHISIVSQHSYSGYLLQIAILIEVVLFSQGLAERINLMKKELNETLFQQEKREKEVEKERIMIIQEKNKELERSNQRLDTFFYRTAHDLRGPIASIMGLCQVALEDVKDQIAKVYLSKLDSNANKLNGILEKLYNAYKINKESVNYSNIFLKNFISQIIHEERHLSQNSSASITTTINDDLNFFSDASILHHLLSNIIGNALKFNDPFQSVHSVYISASFDGQQIILSVKDNGIGIKEEDVPFIYDLFSKAALPYKSSGIGLYIAKAAAEKLNGKIIYKRVEEVSVFSIYLPTDIPG